MTRQAQTGELRSPHLLLGDCAEQMRTFADNSINAIVTDPPYGLNFMGMDFDNPKMMGQSPVMHGGLQRYNKGEKRTGYADCDNAKFQSYLTPIFAEALRVAKPGAHLLAFGGARTYHRLACAIEDAGWEIRDCIMWVYGSGFPKSMDVSKAIDKAMGAEREVVGKSNRGCGANLVKIQNHCKGDTGIGFWDGTGKTFDITAPATPEAAAWNGWGTCLKPAVEPIVIARKPLEGTVAANVLKYGTGAINIDGCRVPTSDKLGGGMKAGTAQKGWDRPFMHDPDKQAAFVERKKANVEKSEALGRFPANLIHDGSDEVLALFPNSKGQCGAVKGNEPSELTRGIYGKFSGDRLPCSPRNDSGSAARFFYCAKASRSERGSFNDHCTVKPLALMRYLVRLVTSKGGTVLDPFMGSGTTGVAAIEEGMNFVGIERDPHYYEIATRRISAAKPEPPTLTQQELPL